MSTHATTDDGFLSILGIYVKGLLYLVASALGVFAVLCLVVTLSAYPVQVLQVIPPVATCVCFLIVLCIGWNDKPDSPAGYLWRITLWVTYLAFCFESIAPVVSAA